MRWFDSGRGHSFEAVSEAALRVGTGPDTHAEFVFVYQTSTAKQVALLCRGAWTTWPEGSPGWQSGTSTALFRLFECPGLHLVYGEPGELIFKPRGQWHTFWNAGTTKEARILEVISPAGFEGYFEELSTSCRSLVLPTPSRWRPSLHATGWRSISRAFLG